MTIDVAVALQCVRPQAQHGVGALNIGIFRRPSLYDVREAANAAVAGGGKTGDPSGWKRAVEGRNGGYTSRRWTFVVGALPAQLRVFFGRNVLVDIPFGGVPTAVRIWVVCEASAKAPHLFLTLVHDNLSVSHVNPFRWPYMRENCLWIR